MTTPVTTLMITLMITQVDDSDKVKGRAASRRRMVRAICLGLLLALWCHQPVRAQNSTDLAALRGEGLDLLVRYLRIDTTNPPGNEVAAARFFADICQREGIEHRLFESAPGRGIIWARLAGDGSRRPLILLNHLDVVPHSPEFWSIPAFGGQTRSGFIYGRGALDMKSLAIAQFVSMLALKRSKSRLARDVIFLGTADEEAGGEFGAGWFVKNHPELLGDAEYLLNEGGGNVITPDGRLVAVGLSPAEKSPAWLKLTAVAEPGHASVPRSDSAVNRLVRALGRLMDYSPPLRLTRIVEQSFQSFAPILGERDSTRYAAFGESLRDPSFLRAIEADPSTRALLHNTISVTMLEAGSKVNVIPPLAVARLDTRLVPGQKLDEWIAELASIIRDERITIEPFMAFEATESPLDTELAKRLQEAVGRRFPGVIVTYPVMAGFTDSHYFRRLGIRSYGFSPFFAPQSQLGTGYHGNDERIGEKAFSDGVEIFYQVLWSIVRAD